MLIEFNESLPLPVEEVYPYFRTPRDWPRLFGAFGDVVDRGGGWYAVPLRRSPFPLVARITPDEPLRSVAWEFAGFWSGEAQVSFAPAGDGVLVTGHERISVRPLFWLPPVVERLFLERPFRRIWAAGWRRLRRLAAQRNGSVSTFA